MRVNRFFSSVVRIQSDRGQYVVTTGPYAVIRHPGYVAGIADHRGERHRARLMARGGASWSITTLPFLLYRAITRGSHSSGGLAGYRDYAAACAGGCCRDLVRGTRDLAQSLHVGSIILRFA